MSDDLAEAFRRQRAHAERAARVDRRGWTDEQWCAEADRLMHDIDGAITSLVNGHVMALLRRRRLLDEMARIIGEWNEDADADSVETLEELVRLLAAAT